MNEQTRKELLKLVKNNYSDIASEFSQTRLKPVWPELAQLITSLIEPEQHYRLLDVGCGNGRILSVLPPAQIDYTGLDNCHELLVIARELAVDRGWPQAVFTSADILNLSAYPAINFDIILAIAVLNHVPDRRLRLDAMRQLKSKLKNNGYLVLSVWNLWGESKYRRLMIKLWLLKIFLKKNQLDFGDLLFDWKGSAQPSQRYYHAFTKRELKGLALAAGLKIVKLYKDQHNIYLVAKK